MCWRTTRTSQMPTAVSHMKVGMRVQGKGLQRWLGSQFINCWQQQFLAFCFIHSVLLWVYDVPCLCVSVFMCPHFSSWSYYWKNRLSLSLSFSIWGMQGSPVTSSLCACVRFVQQGTVFIRSALSSHFGACVVVTPLWVLYPVRWTTEMLDNNDSVCLTSVLLSHFNFSRYLFANVKESAGKICVA